MAAVWPEEMQLLGLERDRALAEFRAQLREWRLTMPAVEPLVIDFGLGNFRRVGIIEYWVVNEEKAGYCGRFVFLFDGQTYPSHRHGRKHETFFVIRGETVLRSDGSEKRLSEGDTVGLPPGKDHSFVGVGNALLLAVSTPWSARDSEFEDQRIGDGGMV